MSRILFKKHLPGAIMPTRATPHSAAFDLYAADIAFNVDQQAMVVDTGLTVAFDTGHALFLYGRSGLAMKHGIRLCNSVGVIDADYRGPLKILLRSDVLSGGELRRLVKVGDRVAQAILMPIPEVEWVNVEELDETARGAGGFGSTGS